MANLHAPWTFVQGDQDNRNNGIVYDSRGYILNRRAVMNEDDRAVMVVAAAAPDMLAALCAIRDDLKEIGLWNYYSEQKAAGLSGACVEIDMAILKAEGKA